MTAEEVSLEHLRGLVTSRMGYYLQNTFDHDAVSFRLINDYPSRPGKGIRPALCLAACGLLGGNILNALNTATTIEFLHNAFLIKDDLVDGSVYRRHDVTLNRKYGFELAMNTGDALNVLGMTPLFDNLKELGVQKSLQIIREIHRMAAKSVEGQCMELSWVKSNKLDLTPDDYYLMAERKTCWYTCITPCRTGAIIGARSIKASDLESITGFARSIGLGFQIRDDVLNLVASFENYGKEINGDIREGKRTLMLIHLLRSCSDDERDRIGRKLSKSRMKKTNEEVEFIRRAMDRYGSIDASIRVAQGFGSRARKTLERSGWAKEARWKEFFIELTGYLVEREM